MVAVDLTSFARVLGGAKRLEGSGANRPTNVSRIWGTAVSDSADGKVLVDLDAQVFSGDGSQYVELDTSDNVREGDRVYVDLVGADGRGKAMMVSGVPGSGDRQQEEIDSAAELADAASAVANATAQHFWVDSNGAHVSTDADDAEGTQNSLWNSLGMLFRAGADNLLALVTGTSPGMLIYDGGGNADSNIIASFVGNLIELGRNSASSVIRMCGGVGTLFVDSDASGGEYFVISTQEPSQVSPQIRMQKLDNGDYMSDGGIIEISTERATTTGSSVASIDIVNTPSSGNWIRLDADVLYGMDTGSSGAIKPVGVYQVTMTTPANNGADVTVTLFNQTDAFITVYDADYSVFITPEGSPNGFTHISYVVTNKTRTQFTIHSYNDYTSAITQTLNVLVMHI